MSIIRNSHTVSNDGRTASTFSEYEHGKAWLVVDDVKQTEYDGVGNPIFRNDGLHLAYAARSGKKTFLVFNGEEQEGKFDDVGDPVFSPNGKHVAFAAKIGNDEWTVVIDGNTEGIKYAAIGREMILLGGAGGSCCIRYTVPDKDSKRYVYDSLVGGRRQEMIRGRWASFLKIKET